MKKLILFSLILSFGIVAQEKKDNSGVPELQDELAPEEIYNKHLLKSYDWDGVLSAEEESQNKYISMKPLSWDELQLYQMDSLLSAEELHLSKHCPTTLKKLQETYDSAEQHMQHILGVNYVWSELSNAEELKCFVIHKDFGTIESEEDKIINPNHYELLNVTQARILKSASKSIGFKEKGHDELFRVASQHNQRVKNIPYEKYGGMTNVLNYMTNNKPAYQLDKEYNKSLRTVKNGVVTSRKIPSYQLFEMTYSEEQKQELINQAKQQAEEKKKSNKY